MIGVMSQPKLVRQFSDCLRTEAEIAKMFDKARLYQIQKAKDRAPVHLRQLPQNNRFGVAVMRAINPRSQARAIFM